MNISYDYYKIFYYVAKLGSITKAAGALLNNQPNITRAIKTLEGELGCKLFIRTNKGVHLTPEGEALYAHISLAFEHIRAGEDELELNRGQGKGSISIGTSEIALRCFLLPILNEYRTKYPNVRIKISNSNTPDAIAATGDGLVDLAVVTTPVKVAEGVVCRSLLELGETAICGEVIYKRMASQNISLRELSQYPLISLGSRTATYALYAELFSKHGLVFAPEIEAATADQILALVKHNLGVGFVPKSFLSDKSESEGVYSINLVEEIPTRTICLITKKGRSLSLPAKELEEMILAAR